MVLTAHIFSFLLSFFLFFTHYSGIISSVIFLIQEHNERRRKKRNEENIVLVQINQTVTISDETSVKRGKVHVIVCFHLFLVTRRKFDFFRKF